jgi:hypothetical protein
MGLQCNTVLRIFDFLCENGPGEFASGTGFIRSSCTDWIYTENVMNCKRIGHFVLKDSWQFARELHRKLQTSSGTDYYINQLTCPLQNSKLHNLLPCCQLDSILKAIHMTEVRKTSCFQTRFHLVEYLTKICHLFGYSPRREKDVLLPILTTCLWLSYNSKESPMLWVPHCCRHARRPNLESLS